MRGEPAAEPVSELANSALPLLAERSSACCICGDEAAEGSLHSGPPRWRQVCNGSVEELPELRICQQVVDTCRCIGEPPEIHLFGGACSAALAAASNRACLPDSERERPTERGAFGLVTMRLLEELHHRSLRGIVRIGSVSRDTGADSVDAGVERPEDGPEGRAVAISNPREEAIEIVGKKQRSVTAAAGSGGAATVAVVAGACCLAIVAGAGGALGLDGVAGAALAAVTGVGLGRGRLCSILAAVTGVGDGCRQHHQGERNSRKEESEERHVGLLLTTPKVGHKTIGLSLPERDRV